MSVAIARRNVCEVTGWAVSDGAVVGIGAGRHLDLAGVAAACVHVATDRDLSRAWVQLRKPVWRGDVSLRRDRAVPGGHDRLVRVQPAVAVKLIEALAGVVAMRVRRRPVYA